MADELVKKRITEYGTEVAVDELDNSDVIFVDSTQHGTRKLRLKGIRDIISGIQNESIKSSGVSVTADNYATTITNVNDQPVNTIYAYAAGLQLSVTNLPSNNALNIMHYTYKYSVATNVGQVQIAIERSGENPAMYFRTTGGTPVTWGSWVKVANNADIEAIREELDNLDIETDTTLSISGKPADAKAAGDAINDLKADLSDIGDNFNKFAYGLKYLTQFQNGTYKWYEMSLSNGTQIVLKTLDGSAYANGALLLYDNRSGTQLGTIYPKIIDDTAYFTIDKDGVQCIRTGSDFSHGASDVYLVVDGVNAEQRIDKLEAQTSSAFDIKHIFGFEFGDVSSSGAFVSSKRRMATPLIQHYDYDIIIPKRNGYTACGVCKYDDSNGTNPTIVGIVNANFDHLLTAGTYFRLYIYNPDNTQTVTGKTYDNLIYNDFHAFNRDKSEALIRSGNYKDSYIYNKNIRTVCHRGASRISPENTLPAFIEARRWGFEWVEADVAWTSDGIPVILHDATIDRTSDGTGEISSLTYDEIKNLDFGSWFSSKYTGTKIPKLDEFLQLCRKIGLKARLDINHERVGTQLEDTCRLVVRNGMKDNTEFIGYNVTTLERIKAIIPTATLIYLVTTVNSQAVSDALSLKTDVNEVHLLTQTINSTVVDLCANALIPLEYWTAGTYSKIRELDPYVTVVTAEDSSGGTPLVAGRLLYESVISARS